MGIYKFAELDKERICYCRQCKHTEHLNRNYSVKCPKCNSAEYFAARKWKNIDIHDSGVILDKKMSELESEEGQKILKDIYNL